MRSYRGMMVAGLAVLFLAVVIAPVFGDVGDNRVPFMRRVEPAVVKAGEEATVYGEALDKSKVADVYLTAEGKQVRVEVVEQSESMITFVVPANLEPGKYNPAVMMTKEPMVLVQPVILTVKPAK